LRKNRPSTQKNRLPKEFQKVIKEKSGHALAYIEINPGFYTRASENLKKARIDDDEWY